MFTLKKSTELPPTEVKVETEVTFPQAIGMSNERGKEVFDLVIESFKTTNTDAETFKLLQEKLSGVELSYATYHLGHVVRQKMQKSEPAAEFLSVIGSFLDALIAKPQAKKEGKTVSKIAKQNGKKK